MGSLRPESENRTVSHVLFDRRRQLYGNGLYNDASNWCNSWTERAFIGVMETSDPASNVWTDKGMVTTSPTDKGFNYYRSSTSDWNAYFKYNAIDPTYIICPDGKHYLLYGSWHSGIVALRINPNTGKPYTTQGNPWGNISTYGQLVYSRNLNSRWQGSEGPEVVYHNGYYYLFLAYDELSVAYNTRVLRSKNILGPYYGKDGRNCTASGGKPTPSLPIPIALMDIAAGSVCRIVVSLMTGRATGSLPHRDDCPPTPMAMHIPTPL